MRVTGSTVQTVSAITWGLAVGVAPLAHDAPSPFWTALGSLLTVLAMVVISLGTAKLLGDALWPDWIDRWWDPPDEP